MFKKTIVSSLLLTYGSLQAATPEIQTAFDPPINIPGSDRILAASPTIANIVGDSRPEIIIGDSKGKVYAYNSAGNQVWQHDTGNVAIESKPAVVDLDLDGNPEVIVTSGSTRTPGGTGGAPGSMSILNGQNGTEICRYEPPQFAGSNRGAYASPAVANLDKSDPELEIVLGDWGAIINVFNHDCSIVWTSQRAPAVSGQQLPPDYNEMLAPYTVYVNDTIWSSPAIADMNADGQLDIIIGVDTHIDDNDLTIDGGRVLVINGNDGTVQVAIDTEEVIWSSPAIADLDNDGRLDIIVGMGYCWQNANCAPPPNGVQNVDNKIFAWDRNGNNLPGWPYSLGSNHAVQTSSPALGDIDGDGFLEVVLNTFAIDTLPPANPQATGTVRVIEHTGQQKWATIPMIPAGQTNFTSYAASSASPIIADITGDGNFEVVVPSNWELAVYDSNGQQISRQDPNSGPDDLTLLGNFPFLATPSIKDLDNDGDLELIAVGGTVAVTPRPATIYVWDLTTSADDFQPWTSFRNGDFNQGLFIKPDFIFNSGFE